MIRYEVVPSKRWFNVFTGATASLYGAAPYGEGWEVQSVGYTIRDNVTNTVGMGRKPFTELSEAQAFAERLNNR